MSTDPLAALRRRLIRTAFNDPPGGLSYEDVERLLTIAEAAESFAISTYVFPLTGFRGDQAFRWDALTHALAALETAKGDA